MTSSIRFATPGRATSVSPCAAVDHQADVLARHLTAKLAGVTSPRAMRGPRAAMMLPARNFENRPSPSIGSIALARAIAITSASPRADREQHAVPEQLVGGGEVGPLADVPHLAGHARELGADLLEVARRP